MASNTRGSNARTHNSLSNTTEIYSSSASARNRNLQLELDDVIASLASSTENRRARQVSKWESMRRQAFRVPA